MRCQACEKNETTTAVICEGCRTHYDAIREGKYHEHELKSDDGVLLFHSWVAVATTGAKKAQRDDKAKRGFFGRKAPEPPAAEEPPPPPPDWKNRVFPADGGDDAAAAAAIAASAAIVEGTAHDLNFGYGMEPGEPAEGETEQHVFDLGLSASVPAAIPDLDLGPAPAVLDLDLGAALPVLDLDLGAAPPVLDLDLGAAPPVLDLDLGATKPILDLDFGTPAPVAEPDLDAPKPVLDLDLGAAPIMDLDAPAPVFEFDLGIAATPVIVPEPEPEPEPPSAALSSFFESLSAPAEPVAEAAIPAPEAAAGGTSLASFFDSLGAAPEAPVEAAAATPEPAGGTSLASFFDSLSTDAAAPVAPVEEPVAFVPEPVAPVEEPVAFVPEPVAPVDEPVAFVPEPMAPVEEPIAFVPEPMAPAEEPVAIVEEPVFEIPPDPFPPYAEATPSPDLSQFFESLASPAPQGTAPGAEATDFFAAMTGSDPAPDAPSELPDPPGGAAAPATTLGGFFDTATDTLDAAPSWEQEGTGDAVDPEARADSGAPTTSEEPDMAPDEGRKPFEIQIEMPGAKPQAGEHAKGKPFSISLDAPPTAHVLDPNRPLTKAEEMAKQSTGSMSFESADDDGPVEGLLDGLKYQPGSSGAQYSDSSHRSARDEDDDDDSKVIDL